MRNLVVPALAAIALVGAIAPAAAETLIVKVSHSDLDLATEAGKKALETRLAVAVKTVCAKPDTRALKAMQAWESCKDDAAGSAHEQLEKTIAFASL